MRDLAAWCFRHRRIVLALWVVALIALQAASSSVGSDYKDTFKLKDSPSKQALDLLREAAPQAAGDSDQIVFHALRGKLTDDAAQHTVQHLLRQVATMKHVGAVSSPYGARGRAQMAKGKTIAYATVTFDEDVTTLPIHDVNRVIHAAQAIAGPSLQVELGGSAIERASPPPAGHGTQEGVAMALIVLLIVFGSLLAAVLPIVTAVFALGTGVAAIDLLSNAITMASFSQQLALLIGLGVGVDYALFIVTRYRQAMLRGKTSEEAIIQSLDTSGRAVLFAGVTVCIALLGMFALGVSFLYGVAVAASLVVLFTVVAALTLLPALLGFFGQRVLGRANVRRLAAGEHTTSDESAGWARWSATLERRPVLLATAAALVMLAIASPALSMRLGASDAGSDPTDSTTRKAYDLLAEGFGPGFNGPLQLVAEVVQPSELAQFGRVVDAVRDDPDVVRASDPQMIGRGVAVAQVIAKGSPQDASTTDLVHRLRDTVVPQHEEGRVDVKVGGQTAVFVDFAATLSAKLPLFIGIVVLLSFLLLMAVFRSLLIPLMAAAMNLLSVVAAFGVVTAVFQHGVGADLIGVSRTGPIEAFVPVMMFAILFGLSMDYEVFLMSRIYEEWHRRRDNKAAIVHGLAATGRTITAAAAIMVLVFAAFIFGGVRLIKLFGLGLASAVLLDAIVVRSVLVPGLMLLAGTRNWWLPASLDRLIPRLNVEGSLEDPLPDAGDGGATSPVKPPAPRDPRADDAPPL
ncbi:MAG: MMPL family transporter [Solirubrobacteraceae bacterium]